MTLTDDHCDFHGGYCDPMGCDTAVAVQTPDKPHMWQLWCGQCFEGAEAQWGLLNDLQIMRIVGKLELKNQASGLSFEHRGSDQQAWLAWLRRFDTANQMRWFVVRRSQGARVRT